MNRNAYRGIYTDEYLDGPTVEDREARKQHLQGRGFKAMIGYVLSANKPARDFYERTGGRPVPSTEELVDAGGGKEYALVYLWEFWSIRLPALAPALTLKF